MLLINLHLEHSARTGLTTKASLDRPYTCACPHPHLHMDTPYLGPDAQRASSPHRVPAAPIGAGLRMAANPGPTGGPLGNPAPQQSLATPLHPAADSDASSFLFGAEGGTELRSEQRSEQRSQVPAQVPRAYSPLVAEALKKEMSGSVNNFLARLGSEQTAPIHGYQTGLVGASADDHGRATCTKSLMSTHGTECHDVCTCPHIFI